MQLNPFEKCTAFKMPYLTKVFQRNYLICILKKLEKENQLKRKLRRRNKMKRSNTIKHKIEKQQIKPNKFQQIDKMGKSLNLMIRIKRRHKLSISALEVTVYNFGRPISSYYDERTGNTK